MHQCALFDRICCCLFVQKCCSALMLEKAALKGADLYSGGKEVRCGTIQFLQVFISHPLKKGEVLPDTGFVLTVVLSRIS